MLLTGLALVGAFPAYAGWWDGAATGCICDLAPDASPWSRVERHLAGLAGGDRPVAFYWLAVVPVVYALSALWFAWAARRTGMRQRWQVHALVGVGAVLALLLTVFPPVDSWISPSTRPVLTPVVALAVGLVALGSVEHQRVLVAAGVAVAGVGFAIGALRYHVSHLSDSGWGNVGQALLAPSVELGLVGLLVVMGALLLHATQRRALRTPIIGLSPELA